MGARVGAQATNKVLSLNRPDFCWCGILYRSLVHSRIHSLVHSHACRHTRTDVDPYCFKADFRENEALFVQKTNIETVWVRICTSVWAGVWWTYEWTSGRASGQVSARAHGGVREWVYGWVGENVVLDVSSFLAVRCKPQPLVVANRGSQWNCKQWFVPRGTSAICTRASKAGFFCMS